MAHEYASSGHRLKAPRDGSRGAHRGPDLPAGWSAERPCTRRRSLRGFSRRARAGFRLDLARAFSELHRILRPGGLLTVGFSGAATLRRFGAITQHGFRFHENAALIEAASAAGFVDVRVVELHGRVTEGDYVLRGSR